MLRYSPINGDYGQAHWKGGYNDACDEWESYHAEAMKAQRDEIIADLESLLRAEVIASDEKSKIGIGFVMSDGVKGIIQKLRIVDDGKH